MRWKSGGTLRAVTGSSRRGKTLICEFGAIVEDELAHASPGDFLFFENIREACGERLCRLRLQRRRRALQAPVVRSRDARISMSLVPLTAKGRMLATADAAQGAAEGLSSRTARWSGRSTKTLRRRAARRSWPPTAPTTDLQVHSLDMKTGPRGPRFCSYDESARLRRRRAWQRGAGQIRSRRA